MHTKELQTRRIIEHEVEVRTRQLNDARAYLVSSVNSLEQGFILFNRDAAVELSNDRAGVYLKQTDTELAGANVDKAVQNLAWNIDLAKLVRSVLVKHKARHQQAASKDGSFYHVFVTPVLVSDEVLGATVFVEDVTEQKILDRSKDEFFSIASHELRTPLTAIRGNMSMLESYFPEAMKDEGVKGIVEDAHSASTRLIEIVNDFLDSSALEQGKMRFSIAPVAASEVIQGVEADLKPLIAAQDNTIVADHLDKLPKILADAGRLRQVVYNLLSNANKYSAHAVITISGEVDGQNLELRFADTGKGISPENQKLLFHKFQQAGESILTRDNTKGTGLGLYIARLLATHMRGSVELEHSEVGKGSTFVVRMPLA